VANYYCEVIVGHGKYPPGVYTFADDTRYGLWEKQHTIMIGLSNWVWKETEDRVVWIKNRSRATPDLLTPDELKQFMWTKLKAKEFVV
jgi:hypothetical protein